MDVINHSSILVLTLIHVNKMATGKEMHCECLQIRMFSSFCKTILKIIPDYTDWTSLFLSLLTTWWRHQMGPFSALLALCAGNSPVPVNSPHNGQWCRSLVFSLIWVWINDWVNKHEVGDLKRHRGHYDVIVMMYNIGIKHDNITQDIKIKWHW